jgi:hypothetical protein
MHTGCLMSSTHSIRPRIRSFRAEEEGLLQRRPASRSRRLIVAAAVGWPRRHCQRTTSLRPFEAAVRGVMIIQHLGKKASLRASDERA